MPTSDTKDSDISHRQSFHAFDIGIHSLAEALLKQNSILHYIYDALSLHYITCHCLFSDHCHYHFHCSQNFTSLYKEEIWHYD